MGAINYPVEDSADSGLNDTVVRKGALTVLFTLIAALAVLYRSIYPLEIGLQSGYSAQIPLVFWPALIAALVVAFFLCTSTSSDLAKFAYLVFISVLINYNQYVFFNFTGGDSAGEISRWFMIKGLPEFSVGLFEYFQWPMHFVFFESFNKILSLPLMDMIRLGYLSLYVLFTVAVVYFFYIYTSKALYWVAASLSYILYMMLFLNNQLVPQFFALVLLIFLFSLGSINSLRRRFLQLVLYTAIVLSHPFFFIFYLSFLSIFPFAKSLKDTLVEFGGHGAPIYASFYRTLTSPFGSLRAWVSDSLRGFLRNSLPIISVLSAIYLFFFFLRFEIFNDRVLDLLSKEANTQYGSSTVLSDLLGLVGGSSAEASGPEPRLLYSLSSELLHSVTAYTVMAIFVMLFLLSVTVFIRKSAEHLSPVQISIGLAGIVYYIGGFFLPIIGPRGLQLGLLPIGALIAGWKGDTKVIKVVVILALVLSPMIGLNGIVNASIAGGGNTQNLHAHEAGKHVVEYDLADGETVLKYPHAGLPPEFTTEQDENVVSLEEVIEWNYTPALHVYGPRQVHTANRYRQSCNFAPERRNVLFDNGVKILSDSRVSGEFGCTRE